MQNHGMLQVANKEYSCEVSEKSRSQHCDGDSFDYLSATLRTDRLVCWQASSRLPLVTVVIERTNQNGPFFICREM